MILAVCKIRFLVQVDSSECHMSLVRPAFSLQDGFVPPHKQISRLLLWLDKSYVQMNKL